MDSKIGKKVEIHFKPYKQNQVVHLSILMEDSSKDKHQAQVINSLVDR